MKSYIWAHGAVNTSQLRWIPLIMVRNEDTHHLLYYRGNVELFFGTAGSVHFCSEYKHTLYAWLISTWKKNPPLFQSTSILFPPSPNTHICLFITFSSSPSSISLLLFSSRHLIQLEQVDAAAPAAPALSYVFLKLEALQLWRSLPLTAAGSFFESIIKLADVGMNLWFMCRAEPSLQSELLKLYRWGEIEGSCCPRLKKGTPHTVRILNFMRTRKWEWGKW